MSGSAWQLLATRLLELLPTLPGYSDVSVFDGPPNESVPESGKYVTVGFVDGSEAGSYQQERHGNGFQITETGVLRCQFVIDTRPVGLGTPMATVRAEGFALVAALDAELRNDQTLGVLSPASTCSLAVEIQSVAVSSGAAQALIVNVSYQSTF